MIAARIVKPFFCRDCKKIKFLFENPKVVESRNIKRKQNSLRPPKKKSKKEFNPQPSKKISPLYLMRKHKVTYDEAKDMYDRINKENKVTED